MLDGFDEMKPLNNRGRILKTFFADIKDFENFKCIITSRPAYININSFQNAFKVMEFDIQRIDTFYEKIKGEKLNDKKKIEQNLEVLGIPVILYMAMMSGVDISENPTKPEIYNRIFAKEGGIFDKFSFDGTEYDIGNQILRESGNIKKYLSFLQEVAFKMFEKGEAYLSKDECHIPKLKINKETVSVLEFPIKHLFEEVIAKIEFIHKSIYEYFVSDYFFENINKAISKSDEEMACVLGFIFKGNDLSVEILEFLRYKINKKMNDKFNIVYTSFQLMLRDGMLYNTKQYYKDQINCEMNVFSNMLDLLHLWEYNVLKFDSSIRKYMIDGMQYKLNLAETDLRGMDLEGVDLAEANLRNAKLDGVVLTDANLRNANLEGVDLTNVNLVNANLRGIDLAKINLEGVDLSNVILDKGQAQFLYKNYNVKDLQNTQVFVNTKTVSYNQYYKNHLSKFRFFRNIHKALEFWVK